jgi:MFS transporter, PAT family, solute carrier family 33 (acetyl-CoA transportor), member 1
MPKADIATISPVLLVIGLVLPALISESVSKRPLDVFMVGIPLKLITSVLGWLAVQTTHQAYQGGNEPGIYFFGPLVAILVLNEVAGCLIFSSVMSFFARVSDPAIGGTYMTLLNTVTNLGSKWPNATALYLLPKLTYAVCSSKDISSVGSKLSANLSQYDCSHSTAMCASHGGVCNVQLDGYTVESAACVLVGIVWIFFFRDTVAKLQTLPYREWLVIGRDRKAGTGSGLGLGSETESLKREE